MNVPLEIRRQRNQAEAAKLVAALPANIQRILKKLPFAAQWTLAGTVNELRTKGNSDIYMRGIAIGQTTAAYERNEIEQPEFETLALYIGNLPD